jgi:hypothetical protein
MRQETRNKIGLASRARWNNNRLEFKAKIIKGLKAKWADPEFKSKMAELTRARWADPEFKSKMAELTRARWADLEFKSKMVKVSKARWADPEFRLKTSAIWDPASRNKVGETSKALWANPEYRQQRLAQINSEEIKQKRLEEYRRTGKKIPNLPRYLADHPGALHIKLRDPNNVVWEVHNVVKFVEDHLELFEPKYQAYNGRGERKATERIYALTGKKRKRGTTMGGWTLVSATEVLYNGGEDLLNRQQYEIHSI